MLLQGCDILADMILAINSDFVISEGDPTLQLRQLADAGFGYVHWCHHWGSDFIYSQAEIEQIGRWLKEFGLQLLDLHASEGLEKNWLSSEEYQRRAGIELIQNRIAMSAQLGGTAIVLHIQSQPGFAIFQDAFWDRVCYSLDALEPYAKAHNIRIALENLPLNNHSTIEKALTLYAPDFLGVCYDSGHGLLTGEGLEFLERVKDRLLAVHLHDNDTSDDHHQLPFTGKVNWQQLVQLMKVSSYRRPLNLEVAIHQSGMSDVAQFLSEAYCAGTQLANMFS